MQIESLPAMILARNLHLLICLPPRREAARGHVGEDLELYIKCGVQRVKRHVNYRIIQRTSLS